ncbi:MAG: hypothetical protein DRO73_08260 [Candidatus Thorarchaeota archaeon]|nr:MAG: hypothetical protein DRO73_08260 [Candidatus Thorarchaeota archaeon]
MIARRRNDDIRKLIDHIQATLVELFDQMRELRRLLDMPMREETAVPESSSPAEEPPSAPLFSGVEAKGLRTESVGADSDRSASEPSSHGAGESSPRPVEASAPLASADETPPSSRVDAASIRATISRVLDPFAHEVASGDTPAAVLAEHLEEAKNYLITPDRPNERVARDMDIVLRFLRARGERGIRPEERDNILKRIERWKAHLAVSAVPSG